MEEENRERSVGNGNLKPFKKGQSGNPNGRPKKLPDLDTLMAEVLGEDEEGKPQAKELLTALYKKALKGDTRASEILLDRAYGKAKQSIQHSGTLGIQVTYKEQFGNDPLPDDDK